MSVRENGSSDPGVETRVGDGNGMPVSAHSRSLHLVDVAGEFVQVRWSDGLHRQAGTERLELRANCVGLQDFRRGRPPHARAPERRDLDHPERLETTQGLSHRRLAGPELTRYLQFDQARIGFDPSLENRLQQPVLDLLRQRKAPYSVVTSE
jgi:hypothetical protein